MKIHSLIFLVFQVLKVNYFIALWALLSISSLASAQTGTSNSPFTTLAQASNVRSAGIYYFNLGGTSFSTYVNDLGWIQVALDFGNGSGALARTFSLDGPSGSTRGILDPRALAKFTSIAIVGITSSTGNISATTTNSTILGRIASYTSLHQGVNDNTINNNWTGTGSSHLTVNASCVSGLSSLDQNICHICGAYTSFIWMPTYAYQREDWSVGEINNSEYFQLWVRSSSASLPVEFSFFEVRRTASQIQLEWITATETNNDYFVIQQSFDGSSWDSLGVVNGQGTSLSPKKYTYRFIQKANSEMFYRIKQVDFDGKTGYSEIRRLKVSTKPKLTFNNDFILIENLDLVGDEMYTQASLISVSGEVIRVQGEYEKSSIKFSLDGLPAGFYVLTHGGHAYKIVKSR